MEPIDNAFQSIGGESYSCPTCGVSFLDLSSLQNHSKRCINFEAHLAPAAALTGLEPRALTHHPSPAPAPAAPAAPALGLAQQSRSSAVEQAAHHDFDEHEHEADDVVGIHVQVTLPELPVLPELPEPELPIPSPRRPHIAAAAAAAAAATAAAAMQQQRHIAYYHRMALLRRQEKKLHPLHIFGGFINFEQLRASVRKSHSEFDRDTRSLAANYVPKPGRGNLTVLTRKIADKILRNYAHALGLELNSQPVEFYDAAGQKRSLPGFFVDWRSVVRYCAENPFYIGEQLVAGSPLLQSAAPTERRRADGDRIFNHASNSTAYETAVQEERTRRVELRMPWAVYAFIIFQDAEAERDGTSYMMWHMVPAHLPIEEQSKPRAWLTVGIAAKLTFDTPAIAKLPSSVVLRANCDEAYDEAVLLKLFAIAEGGVAVSQTWAPGQEVAQQTIVYPAVHALLLDDPQMHTVLQTTSCCWCMQPNSRRACFSGKVAEREAGQMLAAVQQASEAVQQAEGPRNLELRVAKARFRYLGLRWPPRLPVTFQSKTRLHPYKVAAFASLHNLGLCVLPNLMELTLRLLYDELGSQEFETWLKLVVDYGRTHVASFHSIKGRSRSRGLGGIIRKKPGPPSLRSKSKYDLAQAFRFFLVLVHEPLLTVARRAANEEDDDEEEEEGEEVGAPCEREAASPEERANRARCAIAALEVAAKFSDTAKKPQLSEAATKDGLHAPAISLMALARTAFEGRKNFHLSPNWEKLRHAAEQYRHLGPFVGGTNDEHAEHCQKLVHVAYQNFSGKNQLAVGNVADYLGRYAAMAHAERWLQVSNADLVTSAQLGLTVNVAYLLKTGVADAFRVDDATGRCPGADALSAACVRGDVATVQELLSVRVDPNGCGADGRAHLIAAAAGDAHKCGGDASATVQLLLQQGARPTAKWSRLSAAEWAACSGHAQLARTLNQAGSSLRPGVRPTPRMDPTANRLRPLPAGPERTGRCLDLQWLASSEQGKTITMACPPLKELEYQLRVWCNEGREDVPLASSTTLLKGVLSLAFTLRCNSVRALIPSPRLDENVQAAMLQCMRKAMADARTAEPTGFGVEVAIEKGSGDSALMHQAVTVGTTLVSSSLAALLASTLVRGAFASAAALSAVICSPEGPLKSCSIASIDQPPVAVYDHVPQLPASSLASIDVRPGILFMQHTAADDYGAEDGEMGRSGARLLKLERSILAAYDKSSLGRVAPGRAHAVQEFVEIKHEDALYDCYMAELLLCFEFATPAGSTEALALVRWLDDPPQEELGKLLVNEDEPNPRPSWEETERKLRQVRERKQKSSQKRHAAEGNEDEADEMDAEDGEDDVVCSVCGGADDAGRMLLCDGCEQIGACHTYCCEPKLLKVPKGQWYCDDCRTRRRFRTRGRTSKTEDEEDEEDKDDEEEEDDKDEGADDERAAAEAEAEAEEDNDKSADDSVEEEGSEMDDVDVAEGAGVEQDASEDERAAGNKAPPKKQRMGVGGASGGGRGRGGGGGGRRQRAENFGRIFRRFTYAVRTQDQGAAARLYSKPWYGIVRLSDIRCRAPIVPLPCLTDEDTERWKRSLESIVWAKTASRGTKKVDLMATLRARGSFVYNHHFPSSF